jgi:carbamate kinase
MFLCGAMTQGQIGFLIQQAICEQCNRAGIKRKVATLMTHVAVDPQDAAFQKPSKPVGPFYTEEEAKKLGEETGHVFKEDAGKSWWRRVVASPQPLRVHEMDVIAGLADNGTAVIACGGGGIPVMEQGGLIKGVDAVIDKDRASALIADQWDADLFIILTAVEKVALYFKTDKERFLDSMSVKEAQQYLKDGHFPDGSMGPKIEAAISFVSKNKKRKAIITSPQKAFEAMEGKAGTSVVNG